MAVVGVRNAVHLITYPDSLGGTLAELKAILDRHFAGAVAGVHVLPFYPSSADRGFAPIDYRSVDDRFGAWNDIRAIGEDYDLIIDYMINHLSRHSSFFRHFEQHGDQSPYADMFIRFSRFWPDGAPTREQLDKIYKRKPRDPYVEVSLPDGRTERLWCTFDEEQIDLHWNSEVTRAVVCEHLRSLAEAGPAAIRLDAFAYTTKKPGTSCFFIEPDVWRILELAREAVEPAGVTLLPELHEHYRYQLKLARQGYWVYDFALPMLALHALSFGDARRLRQWFQIAPRRQFTTLDTHDGIGIVDVAGLLSEEEIEQTEHRLYSAGGNVKRRYSAPEYGNLDVYQINCTYYSALGSDDAAYLLARAIQFFWPGVPQVYYVGMLAGENDIEKVERTRVGRDVNRHDYTRAEIEEELRRPVVRRLRRLMEFRSTYPVFDGAVRCLPEPAHRLTLEWVHGPYRAVLEADLAETDFTVRYRKPESGEITILDLDDVEPVRV